MGYPHIPFYIIPPNTLLATFISTLPFNSFIIKPRLFLDISIPNAKIKFSMSFSSVNNLGANSSMITF